MDADILEYFYMQCSILYIVIYLLDNVICMIPGTSLGSRQSFLHGRYMGTSVTGSDYLRSYGSANLTGKCWCDRELIRVWAE